ncbi:MAG: serine hydrolase [Anaerolineae bacterium]|jgi:CubicO group peptidase (beta-lactamase class C family)
MTKRALLVLIIFLVAACSPSEPAIPWPTESWPVSSPGDQGLDAALLDEIHQRIDSGAYGYVDRLLLIRNGQLVMDQTYVHDYERINAGRDPTSHPHNYYHPDWHPYYRGSDLHTPQSVTKGVTSIVIGIAIQRGEIPGPGVAVLDYFEDYEIAHLDNRKQRSTLEDVLTMRAGLEWDEWTYPVGDPRNSVTQLEMSDDWIQFALNLPMAREPGEVFVYNSGASQFPSVIVMEATGLYIDEYAEEVLFRTLGIQDYYWKKTPKGWPDTEGGLYLRAEDLAKIGYLVLHEGVWQGRQIVPQDWIDEMTSPKVADVAPEDLDWNDGYGYQWWLLADRTQEDGQVYGALGYGGQFLFIVPERDLVAVFNAWNIYGTPSSLTIDLFLGQMLPATASE